MTLQTSDNSVTHQGNGLTKVWPYAFRIPDPDSLRVGLFDIATSALTVINPAEYTVTGLGEDDGGEVTYPLGFVVAIPATKRLVIYREVSLTQDIDLTNQTYYPETLEDQLDLIVMQIQQLSGEADRALKVTLGSNLMPDEFIAQLQSGAAVASAQAAIATAQAVIATTQAADAVVTAAAVATSAVHLGAIMMRIGPTLPGGYLPYGEGGTYDPAVYPQFATWMATNHPELASGNLPDYRDYVPRTAGGALGPALRAKQEDAFQGHKHNSDFGTFITNQVFVGGGGSVLLQGPGAGTTFASTPTSDGVNGAPRTAIETRVKSFGVRWMIKVYGAIVDQGTASLVAIQQSYDTIVNGAIFNDRDQAAGAFTSAKKINILKNTLQAWEHIGNIEVLAGLQLGVTGLGAYRSLRGYLQANNTSGSTAINLLVGTGAILDSSYSQRAYAVIGTPSANLVYSTTAVRANMELFFDISPSTVPAFSTFLLSSFNKAKNTVARISNHYIRGGGNGDVMQEVLVRSDVATASDRIRIDASIVCDMFLVLEGIRG